MLQAQVQPAPAVDWRLIEPEEERADGGTYYDITYDGTNSVATPSAVQNLGAPQTAEESGEDWYYAHCNIKQGTDVVGILGVGYTQWPNWYYHGNGCEPPLSLDAPRPAEFETGTLRKGTGVGYLARYDLEQEEAWSRELLPGLLRDGIQDADGNFLVVGIASSNRWIMPLEPGDNAFIRLNQLSLDANTAACGTFNAPFNAKGYVTKLAPDGKILWTTLCNGVTGTDQNLQWSTSSFLTDIAELTIPGTAIRYCAVGRTSQGSAIRPFVAYLDVNGVPVERYAYAPGTPAGWQSGSIAEFVSVEVEQASKNVFLTGYSIAGAHPQIIGTLIDAGEDRTSFLWQRYTGNASDELVTLGSHDPALTNNSSGGGFLPNAGNVKILWPTLGNFSQGGVYGGVANVATLLLHGLDAAGHVVWTSDMGEVRAYDLKADMTPTADGLAAIVSSKLSAAYAGQDPPFGWNDLEPAQQQCLNGTYGYNSAYGMDWDNVPTTNPGSNGNPAPIYGFWNTDAYVAKIDPSNGDLVWETRFDAHPGTPRACPPQNMRMQECMYKVSETGDGGLVVSGNTSDNFDDFYLAKLKSDCQAKVDYANSPPLGPDGTYHVTGNETWSSSRNVHGRIIIDPGARLTINNGAVISFADSKQLDHPTYMTVAASGKLVVNGNAKLTSIAQCPSSVWDGIEVLGNYGAAQDPITNSPQGFAYLSDATVENARTALVAGDPQSFDAPNMVFLSFNGGIIQATRTTFRNNRYDAVFHRYENHLPNDPQHVLDNYSFFSQCDFRWDALLQDGRKPADHAWLSSVRGMRFLGCSFSGIYQADNTYNGLCQVGTGIRSNTSSFTVGSKCTVNVPWGTPCPTQNLVKTSFDKLNQGVLATNNQPGRTFSVDQAGFTNCPKAIRMEGISDAAVIRSNFTVVDYLNPNILSTPYGLYSDQCTGYQIEENVFTSFGSANKARTGLVIKDSGPEHNSFYNNRFDGFLSANSVASLIQGANADAQQNYLVGLEVKCNEYGQHGGKNRFDVALTGSSPTVQKNQGWVIQDQDDYTAPAGNLFSLLGQSESDWHVTGSSNSVNYFHHIGSNDPWVPQFHSTNYFVPTAAGGFWPTNRSQACPSHIDDGVDEELAQAQSAAAHQELTGSQSEYDATKDNGDTYNLESYVADPAHGSDQVRNALQSVAPNVGIEVWDAVFLRQPPMDPWHLTQALLTNSPLQAEVMQRCYEGALDDFHYNLVASAQDGGINPLSVLEGAIGGHAGEKAEALTGLGRISWLDSLDVGSAITSLKMWHDSLPAANGAQVQAGYLAAQYDMPALEALAQEQANLSAAGTAWEVLRRYAAAEQDQGAFHPSETDRQWLEALAQDRWTAGSAQASAWLQWATGAEPLEEVIILPGTLEPRSSPQTPPRWRPQVNVPVLEAYPNPSNGPVYVVCNVPASAERASLILHDLKGRAVGQLVVDPGMGLAELRPGALPAGLYLAELRVDGIRTGQVKLALY
jgi:hypothetical protein